MKTKTTLTADHLLFSVLTFFGLLLSNVDLLLGWKTVDLLGPAKKSTAAPVLKTAQYVCSVLFHGRWHVVIDAAHSVEKPDIANHKGKNFILIFCSVASTLADKPVPVQPLQNSAVVATSLHLLTSKKTETKESFVAPSFEHFSTSGKFDGWLHCKYVQCSCISPTRLRHQLVPNFRPSLSNRLLSAQTYPLQIITASNSSVIMLSLSRSSTSTLHPLTCPSPSRSGWTRFTWCLNCNKEWCLGEFRSQVILRLVPTLMCWRSPKCSA